MFMFTGLVQHVGSVTAVQPLEFGARLEIDPAGWSHDPRPGDSIAINGCCLTLAEATRPTRCLAFQIIHETLRVTALGSLQPGDRVNLEHAATPATLLGGHIVQGHVDGVGTIARVDHDDGECRLAIVPPSDLAEFIVARGSVAVDGVSLTIAKAGDEAFEVALIPTTLERTTLGDARTGAHVNLEVDYLAKITIAWLKRMYASAPRT